MVRPLAFRTCAISSRSRSSRARGRTLSTLALNILLRGGLRARVAGERRTCGAPRPRSNQVTCCTESSVPISTKAILADEAGVCTTELLVLRAKAGIDPRFLVTVVHSPAFLDYAVAGTTGVQHPRTSWAHIRDFETPDFALDEQRQFAGVLWPVHEAITHLTIQGIPETARLIMLAGPNGCGKSSFLDALHTWHNWTSQRHRTWEMDYHAKTGSPFRDRLRNDVQTDFHNPIPTPTPKKTLFVRSAYRNDPGFQIQNLQRVGDPLDDIRVPRMIDNDGAVAKNFQRLASQALEDIFAPEDGLVTLNEFRELVIGDIRTAFSKLFSDVELDSLGNPLGDGTFRFTKGTSNGFSFKNLSGGEKAAVDLILDLIVARRAYDDTLFCIDEPESHLNAPLQAELLSVLYGLIPENCQLMLATHSIGMMRRARDIESEHPGSVVFLDFDELDFDEPQVIEPVTPDRVFWNRAHDVALDDLATLVAPERVVICEGEPKNKNAGQNYAHDAPSYEVIFQDKFPETQFVPGGNASGVANDSRGIAYAIGLLIKGSEVVRLIDRDDQSDQQVADMMQGGVRVLSRRNLESYNTCSATRS